MRDAVRRKSMSESKNGVTDKSRWRKLDKKHMCGTQKIYRTEQKPGRQRMMPGCDWFRNEQMCALSLGSVWLWWQEHPCQQQQMREQGVLELSGTPTPTHTALCVVGKGLFVAATSGFKFYKLHTESTILELWKGFLFLKQSFFLSI